jgi:hypothetical protein
MGVSISMRPGSIMRSKGDPIDITPGWRSQAAAILESAFGRSPMELGRDELPLLKSMAIGASVYASDDDNMWCKLMAAVEEHTIITVALEY